MVSRDYGNILCRGYIGIMENGNCYIIVGKLWGYIGIMETLETILHYSRESIGFT